MRRGVAGWWPPVELAIGHARSSPPRGDSMHYGAAQTLVGAGSVNTAHPLGGAAVADTPSAGVVDHRGEVFGHPGLYVADGAAYPAPPGVPPSLTIAALAERQAELLIAEAGR